MSDSTFLFTDPIDSSWEKDKLEPDDLSISVDLEALAQDFIDEGGLRDDAEGAKGRGTRSGDEGWTDLALEEFITDSQKERSHESEETNGVTAQDTTTSTLS